MRGINKMSDYYIGLDIGGTKCAATLGKIHDGEIAICEKEKFATANLPPDIILERFAGFIKAHLKMSLKGIGISCGGPLDSKRGIIMSPPSLPLWDNIDIVSFFENRFGIKTYLQNDSNACALAEYKFGAGKGVKNMVFLTFGTGFGAGLILNGKLYSGANDNAGEIGHVRLTRSGPEGYRKKGSCEGYCSGSGMARLAEIYAKKPCLKNSYDEFTARYGKDKINAKTLADGAREGNAFCKSVYDKSGEMLGKTLAIITDVLNPEKIVIGGVFMRAEDLLRPEMEKTMKKESLSYSYNVVSVVAAKLSENVGDYAALSLASGDFL